MSEVPDDVVACHRCAGEIGHDGLPYCEPSCPTFTEPSAIVRELAARGPFTDCVGGCQFCRFDNHRYGFSEGPFIDPANHEPSCLWRRAKELYP